MNNGPRPYLQIAAARTAVTSWVDSPPVQRVIIALVVVNAITLGLETVPAVMAHMGAALQLLDRLLLTLFVCELLLKLAGHGLRFFRSGWNQMAGVAAGISEHLN